MKHGESLSLDKLPAHEQVEFWKKKALQHRAVAVQLSHNLRDGFAAAAVTGIIAADLDGLTNLEEVSKEAFLIANAMLQERRKISADQILELAATEPVEGPAEGDPPPGLRDEGDHPHAWVYSGEALASNPPRTNRICSLCLKHSFAPLRDPAPSRTEASYYRELIERKLQVEKASLKK